MERVKVSIRKRRGKATRKTKVESDGPTTLMGLLLRAMMLRWNDERIRLHAEVKRTGSVDSGAVTDAAFEVAVHRLFPPGSDLRDVARFAANVHQAFGDYVPLLEMEALIRQELGEDAPTTDIDELTLVKAKTLTIMGVGDVLSWTQCEVDDALTQAEDIAKRNGFNPTVASST